MEPERKPNPECEYTATVLIVTDWRTCVTTAPPINTYLDIGTTTFIYALCTGSLSGPGSLNAGASGSITLSMSQGTVSSTSWSTNAGTLSNKSNSGATITAPSSGSGAISVSVSITCTNNATDTASVSVSYSTPAYCNGSLSGPGSLNAGRVGQHHAEHEPGHGVVNVLVHQRRHAFQQVQQRSRHHRPLVGSGTISVSVSITCTNNATDTASVSISYSTPAYCTGSLSGPGSLDAGASGSITISMSQGTASSVSWTRNAGTLSGTSKTGATITAPGSGSGTITVTAYISCTNGGSDSASVSISYSAVCTGSLSGPGSLDPDASGSVALYMSAGVASAVAWSTNRGTLTDKSKTGVTITAPASGTASIVVSASITCTNQGTDSRSVTISVTVATIEGAADAGALANVLTITAHAGSVWRYKADAGPDAQCLSTAVPVGKVALGGLALATEYTYTLYAGTDASCGSALDTTTFTSLPISVSPDPRTTLSVGTESTFNVSLGGADDDAFTFTPLGATQLRYAGSVYEPGEPFTYNLSSPPKTIQVGARGVAFWGLGFKVRDADGVDYIYSRSLGYPTPGPSPTPALAYLTETAFDLEGGPNQVTAIYKGCCSRAYRLELRQPETQQVLEVRTTIIPPDDGSFAPPAVFAGLQSGRTYGVCLIVYGGDTESPHDGDALCLQTDTYLPTPEPIVPTGLPPTARPTVSTPTPLPRGRPGDLFGMPTPTPTLGIPPTATIPIPTPTPWTETLLYADVSPQWESQGLVNRLGEAQVRITVQWSPVQSADYYECFITDGDGASRIEITDGYTLRQHTWVADVSARPSKIRVRAAQVADQFGAKISTAYGNRVVIPAGQTGYSPFSQELLVSTSVGSIVPPPSEDAFEPPSGDGGALRDLSIIVLDLAGAPHSQARVMSLTLWLLACLALMVSAMGAAGKVAGGVIGPWPFAAGSLVFFAAWSGLGGEVAGLQNPERFLPLVFLGFVGFVALRGRGWFG